MDGSSLPARSLHPAAPWWPVRLRPPASKPGVEIGLQRGQAASPGIGIDQRGPWGPVPVETGAAPPGLPPHAGRSPRCAGPSRARRKRLCSIRAISASDRLALLEAGAVTSKRPASSAVARKTESRSAVILGRIDLVVLDLRPVVGHRCRPPARAPRRAPAFTSIRSCYGRTRSIKPAWRASKRHAGLLDAGRASRSFGP